MSKLLSARFLSTIVLMLTFCYITIIGKVSTECFVSVLSTVIGYYFNKTRKENKNEKTNTNPNGYVAKYVD